MVPALGSPVVCVCVEPVVIYISGFNLFSDGGCGDLQLFLAICGDISRDLG